MCLSIPSRVVEISDDKTMCTVDTMGVRREANLMMMGDDEVAIGDYVLLHILEPVIPHIAHELSETFFASANLAPLRVLHEVLEEESIVLAITVNGKKRDEIEVAKELSKEEIIEAAKTKAAKWLEGKTIVKEIYVPGKLVNLVVK